jgi:hypothetical protein
MEIPGRVPAPFRATPPHLVDEALGLAAWFTEPVGVLSTFLRPRAIDADVAHFIIDVLEPRVRALTTRPDEKAVAMHDWSLATSYATTVRLQMTQWLLNNRRGFSQVSLVSPADENPLMKMGAQVSAAAMTAAGFPLEIVHSLDDVVARLGLRPRADVPR